MEVQLFGPMQTSSASAPPTTSVGAPGAGLSSGLVARGQSQPNVDSHARPGTLTLDSAGPFKFQSGDMLRGQVVGREGGNVLLRFGQTTLGAATELPLAQGQHVDLQVTGQQDGKWGLQLVSSQLFTSMSEQDVNVALMQMNLPATETNVEVAKAMLSMGLPLSGEDIKSLAQGLAQLPREATPKDVLAAVFLKAGSLPMTPGNVQLLAHFMTEHPFIGAQLVSLQGGFRRLLRDESSRASMSDSLIHLLEEAPGLLGELVLEPRNPSKHATSRRLHNMAFQAGIESMGPHVGDDLDMKAWLESLRDRLRELPGVPAGQLAEMLAELEQNLAATRLMNAAAVAEQGSYYLQIPLAPSQLTAEARILYHVDSQGRPVVDDDNVVIELRVPTETLGVVSWRIEVADGRAAFDVAVDTEAGRAAVAEHLHVLMARVEGLGYTVVAPICRAAEKTEEAEQAGLGTVRVPVQAFERLERVDIQA